MYMFLYIVKSVVTTTKVVSLYSANGMVYSIQHYMIKFVSDFRQISGFLPSKDTYKLWLTKHKNSNQCRRQNILRPRQGHLLVYHTTSDYPFDIFILFLNNSPITISCCVTVYLILWIPDNIYRLLKLNPEQKN
jgi:hypothetical protein